MSPERRGAGGLMDEAGAFAELVRRLGLDSGAADTAPDRTSVPIRRC
ncbi:hypothetical protein [Nocardiopsis sp. CA-288880]